MEIDFRPSKTQPMPIPQLLSPYLNAVTREVFSTCDKRRWESHFCHLSPSRSYEIFRLEVPYITHHGHPSHHGPHKTESQQEISIWAARGAIAMASFPTSILGPGTSTAENGAKPESIHLRLKKINNFLPEDSLGLLEEQWK